MITTNEADFYAQHSEWIALNAEYEARFQQWRTKPGYFRSWWKFGAFCIFTGLMWGFLVWGGKALLEIVRR